MAGDRYICKEAKLLSSSQPLQLDDEHDCGGNEDEYNLSDLTKSDESKFLHFPAIILNRISNLI